MTDTAKADLTPAELARHPAPDPSHLLLAMGMTDVPVAGVDLAIQMPNSADRANSRGALQGGIVATLIDVVAGRAALRAVPDAPSVVTSNLNIHYLAPIMTGPAQAEATVLRAGRRSVVVHVDVRDLSTGELSSTATASFAVMRSIDGK